MNSDDYVGAHGRRGGFLGARLQQSGEACSDASDDVKDDHDTVHIDAGRARRIGIRANRAHIASELRVTRMDVTDQKSQVD